MKHLKFLLTAIVLSLYSGNLLYGQYQEDTPVRDSANQGFFPPDFKDKLCFGVQAGLPIFGTPPIDIGIQAGYKFHENFTGGIQINFISTPIVNSNNKFYGFYGPSIFARGFFTKMIFITTEAGIMSMPYFPNVNTSNPVLKRDWEKIILVGMGYKRGLLGDDSYTYATLLYQVIPKGFENNSPYLFPLILKTGIVF